MSGDTIVKESIAVLKHGHRSAGTTRLQLAVEKLAFPASKGILLRCPGDDDPAGANIAEVWIGGPSVTADSDETTGGLPIAPGEAIFLPLEQPDLLYVISTDAAQDVAWIAM